MTFKHIDNTLNLFKKDVYSSCALFFTVACVLPAHEGQTCYGLVLADDNGIPIKVRALSDHYPALCYAGESFYAQPRLMKWAFKVAAAVSNRKENDRINGLYEILPQDRHHPVMV